MLGSALSQATLVVIFNFNSVLGGSCISLRMGRSVRDSPSNGSHMFISHKAAEARLRSSRNTLRERPSIGDPEQLLEETVEIPESGRLERDEDEETKEVNTDLSALDALIYPHRKPSYRGKLEAQVGVAELGLVLPNRASAAALSGLGLSQVKAYERGLQTSAQVHQPHTTTNPALKRKVDALKEVLAEKAAGRIGDCLDLLDNEKLSKVKRATNLSRIAKDMASVLEKCEPKDKAVEGGVHFHIWKPEINVEQNYQTVTIGGERRD